MTDVNAPIQEVREYLTLRYDQAKSLIHPKLFEDTVASVFGDLGYVPVVTAYSGDEGIDIVLHKGSETVGVQVKRYKNSIKVEQIRALAGALMLKGLTKGIFVTTSEFQKGTHGTAERYALSGYMIELLDGKRFLETLELAQREAPASFEEFLDAIEYRTLGKLPLISHEGSM